MPLSNDIISEFVEVTASHVDVKKDTTLYGTIVNFQNKTFVRLDGSDLLTPIASTTEVADGQRVMVMLKNHAATVTGNISDISASSSTVASVREDVVSARKVIADEVEAIEGRFKSLSTEYASIGNLNAANAKIDTLIAEDVKINDKLTAQDADIEKLNTNKLDATTANITFATIENLEASKGEFNELLANKADINHLHADYATIDHLEATYAKVGALDAATADIADLNATFGTFENVTAENFEAVNADIDNLKANKADVKHLHTEYANIDFANITEASIRNLYTKWGIIEEGTFENGEFTGKLVAVEINADSIKSGSLVADRIVVKGEDGLYYKLNVDGNGTIPEEVTEEELQNGLHGSNIIAQSITADKISVSDLMAFKATIAGINIGKGAVSSAMYSGVKNSPGNSTDGFYLDGIGQFAVGNGTEYIKFYKTNDDKWTFAISADNISLTTGETLSGAIASIEANDEAIKSKVSKTELDNTLSGYYTMEQADTAIETSAVGIKTHVSNTYASKTDVGNLSDRVSQTESDISLTSGELSVKLSADEYYGVRRFDRSAAKSDCYEKQGIRVVGRVNPIHRGSGDPNPESNIRVIRGWSNVSVTRCKKNLVDISTIYANSGSAVECSNNTIRVYSTENGTYRGARTDTMVLCAGITYTLSVKVATITSGIPRVGFRYAHNNVFIPGTSVHTSDNDVELTTGEHSVTFTPSEDAIGYLSLLTTWDAASSGDVTFENIQLEMDSSATEYEVFQGDAYKLNFDQTVYGGMLDVSTGELVIDKACVSLTGNETVESRTGSDGLIYYMISGLISDAPASSVLDLISSHYPTTNGVYSGTQGVRFPDSLKSVMLRDSRFQNAADVDGLKAYFADQFAAGTPVQICYTLAEPTTIQIESIDIPAMDGENVLYTNLEAGYIEFGHDSLGGLGGASRFDMDTELNLKAGSAELSTTNENLGNVTEAVLNLSNTISTLVKDKDGASLMTQTEDGWTFSIASFQNALDEATTNIGTLQEGASNTKNGLDALKQSVDDLGEYTDYIDFTAYNDKPCIELGEKDSPFKVLITNTDIQFKEGTSTPASISNQELNIDTAVIDNELRQGGFAWIARSNGNYGLLWKGE